MTYYVYHLPSGNKPHHKNEVDLDKMALIGEYNGIQSARIAAIRFIGKGRKTCVIMDRPMRSYDDIIHWVVLVRYQDGRKLHNDKSVAEAATGWIFVYFKGSRPQELRDYNGKVKYRAQR